ncbi:hypothetical protein MTsPCn7_22260 [Altererythrobacter sp. MTPC7]
MCDSRCSFRFVSSIFRKTARADVKTAIIRMSATEEATNFLRSHLSASVFHLDHDARAFKSKSVA